MPEWSHRAPFHRPRRAAETAGGCAETGDTTSTQPRRFFGSIPLDPDRAGLQVARIAEEILFELTRSDGADVKLTLEIEGRSPEGYSSDTVDVVRSNIRDLKFDPEKVGFEEE